MGKSKDTQRGLFMGEGKEGRVVCLVFFPLPLCIDMYNLVDKAYRMQKHEPLQGQGDGEQWRHLSAPLGANVLG